MKSKCLIVSGGDFSPIPSVGPDTFVIACDRGYEHTLRCGVTPDLLVGDLDSCRVPVDPSIPQLRFPVEKDDTDTLAAIRIAIERGCTEGTLCCALGGRLDHTLANIQSLLFAEEHGLHLRITSADTELCLLRDGSLRLPRREGFSLSVFACTERCAGVSIRGAKYPLEEAELRNSFPLGVSNEWTEEAAEITVADGTLLIVLSHL